MAAYVNEGRAVLVYGGKDIAVGDTVDLSDDDKKVPAVAAWIKEGKLSPEKSKSSSKSEDK